MGKEKGNTMNRLRVLRLAAVGCLAASFLLAPSSRCPAQEVEWRSDYAAARKEASDKNLPLIIDFGTENCFYCKRLDVTTFREPAICTLLNERFVPLKVDAGRYAVLAERLAIQVYPTLIFASPDGRILDRPLTGYVEAAPLRERLLAVLDLVNAPEWMTRDFEAAAQAITGSDYARAITLLKGVVQDGRERSVQLQARQLLQELEQQACGRLARARQLVDRGQAAEALETTTDLVRSFSGTQAAVEASRMLSNLTTPQDPRVQPRKRRAQECLAQAKEDFRTQQYLNCLGRCEVLTTTFADLPEATEAMQLAAEIKNNPEWMRQACDSLSEQLGGMYMALAESWLRKGQPQQAAAILERLVQAFPGSRHAELAQVRLSQITAQPARPVDFKKS
jgi:thioredoxin-related protein